MSDLRPIQLKVLTFKFIDSSSDLNCFKARWLLRKQAKQIVLYNFISLNLQTLHKVGNPFFFLFFSHKKQTNKQTNTEEKNDFTLVGPVMLPTQYRLVGPVVTASSSGAVDLPGSTPSFAVDLFPGRVIRVT